MFATRAVRQTLRVSVVVAALAFTLFVVRSHDALPNGVGSLAAVPLAALVVWIAIVDARTYTIPDAALAALALLAFCLRTDTPFFAYDPLFGFALIALDATVAGGAVLLVREAYYRRRGVDGIGLGDVKLAAVGGMLCGLYGFSVALLAASLSGLVLALVLRRRGSDRAMTSKLPFGAFLAPALWLAWALGF